MPLFEFRCLKCAKTFTFLAGVVSDAAEPACPVCASNNLKKLVSGFRAGRSDDERMDAIAEQLESRELDDPRSLRRFAREMGREIGAETGENLSDEMEELIENESNSSANPHSPTASNSDDGTIY